MPHKARKPPEALTPKQAARVIPRLIERKQGALNLPKQLDRASEHAERVLSDDRAADRLKRLASVIREDMPKLNAAIESGDAARAALHAFRCGAAAAELETWDRIAVEHWLTTAEAGEVLAVRPDTVSDYVAKGILRSNGGTGKGRRLIDPASVCRRLLNEIRTMPPE
ncbi:MAG: hypothetical protein RIK87_00675 [Fuerstiella sp.]